MNEVVLILSFFVIVIGACIGSFLNVVALRAISGESIVFPSSKCPLCNEPIKWYDNIPVLSYLFTFKGKCRNCGGKVSVQYPIVEAITAILFLVMYLLFGLSIKTLLLCILICISIVICITDFKKEYVYDVHSWILIVAAIGTSLYFNGLQNYAKPVVGLLAGVFVMEAIARLSYYLVRKKKVEEDKNSDEVSVEDKQEDGTSTEENSQSSDEDVDINDYVEKNKRAFGEGDTYLAAAAGALLGWQALILSIAMAIILQAVCILPQFLVSLYNQKETRLLFSLSAFIVIALLYWIVSNTVNLHLYVIFAFVILLIFFAIDSITRLKKVVNNQGFIAIPFGPALLISMFITMFFGASIVSFLIKHVFMILG